MNATSMLHELVDKVQGHDSYQEGDPHFVSVYRDEQCYGGPEEGGWWYNRLCFLGSVAFHTKEQAEAFLEQAKKEVEESNREEAPERHRAMANIPEGPDPYPDTEGYIPLGWSDGGKYEVCVEARAGERDNMNEPRPYYE